MIEHTNGHTMHPRPRVELVGTDGNAFELLGLVFRTLREAGWSKEEIDAFQADATEGDYDYLLRTVMKYLEVE